jgi:hypothetical protein
MSTSLVTYDLVPTAPAATRTAKPVAMTKRPGLFARFLAAVMKSRRRHAMEDLRRHGLRIPRELDDAGLNLSRRDEDSLPFGR